MELVDYIYDAASLLKTNYVLMTSLAIYGQFVSFSFITEVGMDITSFDFLFFYLSYIDPTDRSC